METSDELIIIEVGATERVGDTDLTLTEIRAAVAMQRRPIVVKVPAVVAAAGAMAAGGAIWWTMIQVYLWRVGLLR